MVAYAEWNNWYSLTKIDDRKNQFVVSHKMDIQSYIQTVMEEEFDSADEKQEWIDTRLQSVNNLAEYVESIFADLYDLPEPLSDAIMHTIDFPCLFSNLQEYCENEMNTDE